jgi:TolA-binding protein
VAPRALYRLAVSLGQLGKVQEACLTLTEVSIRYPGSEVATQVPAQRQALSCQ